APPPDRSELARRVEELAGEKLREAIRIQTKKERYAALAEIEKITVETLVEEYRNAPAKLDTLAAIEERRAGLQELVTQTRNLLHDMRSRLMRERILSEGEIGRASCRERGGYVGVAGRPQKAYE